MRKYMKKKLECIQKLESIKSIIQEAKEELWMYMTLQDLQIASQSGGQPMEWNSPGTTGYRFLITRHDNPFWDKDPKNPEFVIKIAIYDHFYNYIYTLQCNELDIAAMMDSVEWLIYETESVPMSSISSTFQIDSHGMYPELLLERDYDSIVDEDLGKWKPGYYDEKNDLPRDIKFSIRLYNLINRENSNAGFVPFISFYLSDEELCDFIYDLFFVGLIDLDTDHMNIDHNNLDEDIGRLFLKNIPDNPDYY